jgi:hypothetical protein
MYRRKIAGFACALTLAAPVGLMLGTGSATAAAPVQKCGILTGSATINPGLTTIPANQTIAAKGTAKSCTPAAATKGSGVLTATVKLKNGSCQGLVGGTSLPLVGKITWANKKVSNVNITGKTTSSDPTLATLNGKVSSGLFAGKKVAGKIRFTISGSGGCTPTSPVKKLTFTNKISKTQTVPLTIT